MADAWTSEDTMSTELLRVAERAKRDPDYKFYSLAHLMDKDALNRAFKRLRKTAAVGVDEITVEEYGNNLEGNLDDLLHRLKSKRYRHQPVLRVHISKGNGKTRPIGISTVEDKVVQGALREVLDAVYEQTFLDCSYGFRPKRGTRDALRSLNRRLVRGRTNVILEADIVSFFDNINRKMLLELLQKRVADGSIKRLVGKCIKAGVLDGQNHSTPDTGTTQGSIISPLFGNIYLHYVLDSWFEEEVMPRMKGEAYLIRYADDFVMGFEFQQDAERVWNVLGKRFEKFDLPLHPDKTRLFQFRRPPRNDRKRNPETFDFLGFTWYWKKSRYGTWRPECKTRKAKLCQAIGNIYQWCRKSRTAPVADQHNMLVKKMRGHLAYFGVNGNSNSTHSYVFHSTRAWFKWLCRRGQRKRLTWKRFQDLLKDFPLPRARVVFNLWGFS